ncbi:TetR/AcrR family transcriptional regulator [Actinomycetospora lutea]|uniref:TetR/AcrR family transcriptional regulator n=1 Tax=Actinomycetospora lutea TaxID=663604 RepID=UPI00236603D3|nr:TetR/AcrR family transcriptional regulator [Actinomycetospora lutea]MDD7941486.1 TetR/AcrR family transcriptional regulator [Actinomycetospora lutea]
MSVPAAAGPPGAAGTAHRDRLVQAMIALVAERGYAAVTVADVVAAARVSKRTFYQHFSDREDCFLAAYVAAAEQPLTRIAEAVAPAVEAAPGAEPPSLADEVTAGTSAYLAALAEQPGLTRTLLTEISGLGPQGRRVRREVLNRFAEQLSVLIALGAARWASSEAGPAAVPELAGVRGLPHPTAVALVGGINELVLDAVEDGRGDRLAELTPTVTELILAVVDRTARPS